MIEARIIADSINEHNCRITTFILTFPRIILAEFNTHRMLSRNSASSRAIPFAKMLDMVQKNPFIPIKWMKDHKGMQGTEYFNGQQADWARAQWLEARDQAVIAATDLYDKVGKEKLSKQLCNRLLEPFMWHTVIVTATEWENFFELRCPQYQFDDRVFKSKKDVHFYCNDNRELNWLQINKGQAEIHMMALAEAMWDAYNESTPKELQAGEWYIPFGDKMDMNRLIELAYHFLLANEGYKKEPTKEELFEYITKKLMIQIATARCARVSYLNFEGKDDYKADKLLHDKLIESGHWSPFEHCAQSMSKEEYRHHMQGKFEVDSRYVEFSGQGGGRTETYINGEKGWCGNFRGWMQYRKMFQNENKKDERVKKIT